MEQTNINKLTENVDISQYITFLLGSKYLTDDHKNIDYYLKCKKMTCEFMISDYFNIGKEDFNLSEFIKQRR